MQKFIITLTLAFLLFSCDTEPMSETNPFIGTWESKTSGYRTVFTDKITSVYYPNGNLYWTGTYTYDDVYIKTKLDIEKSVQEIINISVDGIYITMYGFEDDILILNSNPHVRIE